ncbi:MAG: glutamate racemase, partial [Kiloniellales bacterium]|nr:glutamate racemase [Kiloniellales bacterium]
MRSVASTHRILVFDSGVGGLSVLEAIRAAIPGISVLYVADSAFYPYGPKPEAELIARVPVLLAGLCAEHRPDLVVIACNTAST